MRFLLKPLYKSRVPMIFQTENADCGVACLSMILRYYGFRIPDTDLRHHFPGLSRGISLEHIANVSTQLGLPVEAYQADGFDDIDPSLLPSITYWKDNHFVVLTNKTKNSVMINDPATGSLTLSPSEFDHSFRGFILSFVCSKRAPLFLRPSPVIRDVVTTLYGLLKDDTPLAKYALMMFSLTALLCLFAMGAPYYGKLVFDSIVDRVGGDGSRMILFAFLAIMATEALFRYLKSMFTLRFTSSIALSMNKGVFRRMLKLPYVYFQSRNNADILSRINSIYSLRNTITGNIVSMLIDVILVVFSVGILFFTNSTITLFVFVGAVLYAGLSAMILSYLHDLNNAALVVGARQDAFLLETIQSVSSIKLARATEKRTDAYLRKVFDTLSVDVKMGRFFAHRLFFETIMLSGQALVLLYLASNIALSKSLSIGDVFLISSLNNRVFSSAKSLVDNLMSLAGVSAHLERLSDILRSTPDESVSLPDQSDASYNSHVASIVPHSRSVITANAISFSFPGAASPVFSGLSFTIPPHKTRVITGRSGCGKSTLLSCLIGLYSINEGSLTIAGNNIYRDSHYLSSISAVLQTDRLLDGTILDNISFFDENPDIERAASVAASACINDMIESLLMGYHTPVKDIHSTVSAGQSQRILLARALYRNPEIVFLDEATCHLDADTEQTIYNNLSRLPITKVVVAHRQSVIDNADNLICLDKKPQLTDKQTHLNAIEEYSL